jgi:drug/metabolite transporter (DMT)-like permease
MLKALYGSVILILVTILWGSSFVFIKFSVENISGFSYTFYRSLISIASLTPPIAVKIFRKKIDLKSIRYGFITGVSYMLGLLLQGIGTAYTTPSISAFITGLNTVHVHIYTALIEKTYSPLLFLSLVLAITGLYMVTKPSGGLGFGELMVFLGSIAWAAEIVLISRYARRGIKRIEFLYGLLLPSLSLVPYVLFIEKTLNLSYTTWLYLSYLGIACTLVATALQVIGQRYVGEATAAIIYILEPIFALIFSVIIYGEKTELLAVLGGITMVIASAIAILDEILKQKNLDKSLSVSK